MTFEKLAVLVPTRNRADDLRRMIGRMCETGFADSEFLIYDDASAEPEETRRAAREAPRVRVLFGKERRGQAYGRNRLFESCQTEFFVLMDDDSWFDRIGRLPELLANNLAFEEHGSASVIASQVFRTSDGMTIYPPALARGRIPAFVGAGSVFRRSDFCRLGGFRDFYIYRHEETDLSLRYWRQGLSVVYEPSMVVEHFHTSAERDDGEYAYLSARNLILLHGLNLPSVHGAPEGLARALGLLRHPGYPSRKVLAGIRDGLDQLRRRWGSRTPLTLGQYAAFRALRQRTR